MIKNTRLENGDEDASKINSLEESVNNLRIILSKRSERRAFVDSKIDRLEMQLKHLKTIPDERRENISVEQKAAPRPRSSPFLVGRQKERNLWRMEARQ